jgi:hypothetical protein
MICTGMATTARTGNEPRFSFAVGRNIVAGMRQLAVISVFCLLVFPRMASAQVVPGRWEKVDGLPRGSAIIVTLTSGFRAEYAFAESTPELLVLTNDDAIEVRVAKPDVRTVARQRQDRLRNGVLTGAGVGFGAAFLSLAAFNAKQTASGPIWDREAIGYYTAAGLVGAGIGALVGALIDARRKELEVLYSRP